MRNAANETDDDYGDDDRRRVEEGGLLWGRGHQVFVRNSIKIHVRELAAFCRLREAQPEVANVLLANLKKLSTACVGVPSTCHVTLEEGNTSRKSSQAIHFTRSLSACRLQR